MDAEIQLTEREIDNRRRREAYKARRRGLRKVPPAVVCCERELLEIEGAHGLDCVRQIPRRRRER